MKKNIVLVLIIFLTSLSLHGQVRNADSDERFQYIIGPRFGLSYFSMSPEEFTDMVTEIYGSTTQLYQPYVTQFGISFEQRILLGTTNSHFSFQETLVIGGVDQGIAIPGLAGLMGIRLANGFEAGAGPIVGLNGMNVVFALGYTFSFSEVYAPVNLVLVPDIRNGNHVISLYTGFNFTIR
jgi:hypothetical protein